jgi:hypothetical protein
MDLATLVSGYLRYFESGLPPHRELTSIESTQSTGMVGSQVVPWTAAAESPFLRLLAPRAPVLSASPAAGALSSASPANPAPSKSAPRPPRAAAKSQRTGATQRTCPHGVDCPTHGALYGHCKDHHPKDVHDAICPRLRDKGVPFFNNF